MSASTAGGRPRAPAIASTRHSFLFSSGRKKKRRDKENGLPDSALSIACCISVSRGRIRQRSGPSEALSIERLSPHSLRSNGGVGLCLDTWVGMSRTQLWSTPRCSMPRWRAAHLCGPPVRPRVTSPKRRLWAEKLLSEGLRLGSTGAGEVVPQREAAGAAQVRPWRGCSRRVAPAVLRTARDWLRTPPCRPAPERTLVARDSTESPATPLGSPQLLSSQAPCRGMENPIHSPEQELLGASEWRMRVRGVSDDPVGEPGQRQALAYPPAL